MKLYIKNLILFCSLVSVLTSCDLDVVPPAEISAENFWKTEKDAWYALNGCYQSMPAVDIWDEMCTDNAHSHKPWEGNMEMVQQNGINTAAPYGNYDFNAIRTANTYIARVDECDMSEELKVRTKAEARFFRAFAYLTLTQYFGKVAIVTEELPYDAPTIARNSVEEVRNFILTELAEVAEILPESYSGGFMNEIGRVTRYAALALRSRAALYFGNYEEAEKSAKAVIDSGKYSLFKLTSLNAAQEQEAEEMDLYIDFAELGIDKDKFIKGMFSYEALWQGANATPANPEYVLTHEYMGDPNAYDQYRYTYFIPLSMSIQNGYSSFEPMQDLVDAYWKEQEAEEMDLYIDFAELGIDKDKFIKGMFSYEALWQGANATPANPEYVLTHEYMGDPNAYDQYRYTYFIPLSMSIQNGYSSFEPMQDLVDAYWKVDGKTLPEKIQVDARKANYEKIWNYAKNLSEEDYKTFATSPELMSYDYMKEFKNRDSRLYVTLMFPFKGWHETAVGEFYYKWNPDVINKDGNESWTGFSYRKMVAWEPYIASVYGSADDYPTIRYAEVLLTFAEAHLMTTGYDDQVRFALNQLRDRCGMPDVPESLGTQEAIDFLRKERRIELAVEGHRYDDVRRYGNEYCQKYLQGPSTAPNGAVVVDKKWNERLMLMPIPTTAIDVNPLLKEDQNPGY